MEIDMEEKMEAQSSGSSDQQQSSSKEDKPKGPVCVIVLGMAGSGKTSLCSKLIEHLYDCKQMPYVINCDPACQRVDYMCNIDIRDTINYKNVMEKYQLGPNGSIITSLNLFVTNFDQVLTLIDKRKDNYKYALLDTPGQVEVFTWSASGSIITEALASKFATVIVFVVDSVRASNPTTFMSNMLYACSIVYKYKLPIVVVLNKSDAIDTTFALEWMHDSIQFDAAINKDPTYMACLNQSLSSALDIFYEDLPTVSVSAKTGDGMHKLVQAINVAAQDYEDNYRPQFERFKRQAETARLSEKTKDICLNDDGEIDDNLPEKNDSIRTLNAKEDLVTFGPKTTDPF